MAAREDAVLIRSCLKAATDSLIDAGEALLRQKDRLPHGMFLPWLEKEFSMSNDTANNLMRVARIFGGKNRTVRDLNANALYELAKPSTPQEIRERVDALLVDGQKVTVADIRKMKADTKSADLAPRDTGSRHFLNHLSSWLFGGDKEQPDDREKIRC